MLCGPRQLSGNSPSAAAGGCGKQWDAKHMAAASLASGPVTSARHGRARPRGTAAVRRLTQTEARFVIVCGNCSIALIAYGIVIVAALCDAPHMLNLRLDSRHTVSVTPLTISMITVANRLYVSTMKVPGGPQFRREHNVSHFVANTFMCASGLRGCAREPCHHSR